MNNVSVIWQLEYCFTALLQYINSVLAFQQLSAWMLNVKVKERIVLREIHIRTTGRHLSTESHSVICHPTEVTAPPSTQPGRLVLDPTEVTAPPSTQPGKLVLDLIIKCNILDILVFQMHVFYGHLVCLL